MAYSGIVNIGFALLGIFINTFQGLYSAFFFIITYLFLTVILFGVVFMFYKVTGSTNFYFIKDLKGIFVRSPFLGYVLILVMFSYAGIPPLAGFFSKLSVFL